MKELKTAMTILATLAACLTIVCAMGASAPKPVSSFTLTPTGDWTWPGNTPSSLEAHMNGFHKVDTTGKSFSQQVQEHDAIHDVIGPVNFDSDAAAFGYANSTPVSYGSTGGGSYGNYGNGSTGGYSSYTYANYSTNYGSNGGYSGYANQANYGSTGSGSVTLLGQGPNFSSNGGYGLNGNRRRAFFPNARFHRKNR